MVEETKRIAINFSGGYVPGLNAVIKGAVLAASELGWEVVGIHDGFEGLLFPERYPQGGLVLITLISVRQKKKFQFSQTLPFWLVLPAVAMLVSIQIYPTIYSLYLSTTRMRAGNLIFVGFKNFERLLASADFF